MTKGRINILLAEDEPRKAADASATPAPMHHPLAKIDLPRKKRAGAAGSIMHAIQDLSEQSKRGQEIEAKFSNAETILDIDPGMIDPSFARDRMAAFDPEGADADFVAAIRDEGQLVPALLRPNPTAPGRYQPAYGRRRIAAAMHLGRKVRAVVRDLSDEQLVVAQGQENEARNGLTFIEKCLFAATLESQGFKRKVIESALNVAQPNLSTMLQIATEVPGSVVDWVGPASGIGRRKWLDLAKHASDAGIHFRMISFVAGKNISADMPLSSDDRFNALMGALVEQSSQKSASTPWTLPGQKKPYGSLEVTPRRVNLTIDRAANPAFADALIERVEAIRRELESATTPATMSKKG